MTTAPTKAPAPVQLESRVSSKKVVADGVVELTLDVPGDWVAWEPGAHIDLFLTDELTRSYSLCGDPAERNQYRVAILREADGKGGSKFVHDEIQVGQALPLLSPLNHFRLEPSPKYLFIAGGIGITPIIPMIQAAEAAGAEWELLYGGRRIESIAYRAELEEYGDRVTFQPEDTMGRLDLDSLLGTPRADTLVYTCGPEPLLAAIEDRMGPWPDGSLHLERFAANASAFKDTDTPFEVVFARSGQSAIIEPGVSILDKAEELGVFYLKSCSEGICGTCETEVLEGDADHRDSVLTPEDRAAGSVMPCVARCLGDRLVLDL